MSYFEVFKKHLVEKHGLFEEKDMDISRDAIRWERVKKIRSTQEGAMRVVGENDLGERTIIGILQSCYVQLIPRLSTWEGGKPPQQPQRKFGRSSSVGNNINTAGTDTPVVLVKSYDNEKLFLRVTSKGQMVNILSSLMTWQSMKTKGLAKKWQCQRRVVGQENKQESDSEIIGDTRKVLVCRFKMYGPVQKGKESKVVAGPKPPVFESRTISLDNSLGDPVAPNYSSDGYEGWFYTLGSLGSDGILSFLDEKDGSLVYALDVKSLLASEIREVHHSIFQSSNVLFLGRLSDLRWNNRIKNIGPASLSNNSFIFKEGRYVPSRQRIFIEFPLHIDLQDWFVGLHYFAMKEYISCMTKISHNRKEVSRNSDEHGQTAKKALTKDSLRVSKRLFIDIVEADFDKLPQKPSMKKIYAEVVLWGHPWARTALTPISENPFWKENFATDLPILTQMVHIFIKGTTGNRETYLNQDYLIGTVFLTPDILTQELRSSSTMMTSMEDTSRAVSQLKVSDGGGNFNANDINRLQILDELNVPVGRLLLSVKLKEIHILQPKLYKKLEVMLANAPMKDLIDYCNRRVSPSDFEDVSIMLLDCFQSLGVEDQWFKALMETELVDVDSASKFKYVSGKVNKGSSNADTNISNNNIFTTLFRGLSIFAKSLEIYNLRLGQEYLEKLLGYFINEISSHGNDCEVDVRYIHSKLMKQKLGLNDDDIISEDEYDEELEKEINEEAKKRAEKNFQNLYKYTEEIWDKIYHTSNDLPQQMKKQLSNFRTKVELSCHPDDRETSLNCLSAFLFLRFLCPAILNPKLFHITKEHQMGTSQRALTLISKVLLNLGNRQQFSIHKEPHLLKMNSFFEAHLEELYDYFDKITGRKNDFTEKQLDLSYDVKKFDLGFSEDESAHELPTTPFLIDRFLRLTEIAQLLDNKDSQASSSGIPVSTVASSHDTDVDTGRKNSLHPNHGTSVYQIGSLEFEKTEFLDLVNDNDTEDFVKSLCGPDSNIFSFIKDSITMEDLHKQSAAILSRIKELECLLEEPETLNSSSDNATWEEFAILVIDDCYLDNKKRNLVRLDQLSDVVPSYLRNIADPTLSILKLKFGDEQSVAGSTISHSMSTTSIKSFLKPPSKNPFKKLLRKT